MKRSIQLLLAIAFVNFSIYNATAQTSTFTYDGRLNENGSPANGSYDLRFVIYDAATAGTNVTPAFTNAATAVTGGLFSVQLDFGTAPFNGSPRWLDIGVRTNGSTGAFTSLLPRQKITSSPYSI